MAFALALPRRPSSFSAGDDMPVGTYHVESTAGGYTVQRTIGLQRWFPLTAREDPAWLIWSSFEEAQSWIAAQGEDLCDYPFWGR